MAENELTQIIELTEDLTPADDDYLPIQGSAGGTGSTKRTSIAAIRDGVSFATYQRTLFVGKHGADTNDGTNPQTAFLTIGAAITAASALSPGLYSRVSIVIVDSGEYAENIAQPDYVDIDGPLATVRGTVTLGDEVQLRLFRISATANGTTLLDKTSGDNTSFCYINEVDGTGATGAEQPGQGSIVNTFCVKNTSSPGIFFLFTPKIWVPQNGEGIGDSTVGQGHLHVNVEDLYLAGDNALGIAGNIVNSSLIVRFGHILETGSHSGTVGIKMGSSGDCYAVGTQIIADTVWDVNVNRNLRIVCPDTQGSYIGVPQVAFTDNYVVAPSLPTSASGLPTGAFWNDGGTLKIVT
jgi:hypothetical protein